MPRKHSIAAQFGAVFLCLSATAFADPCGMVPPVYVGDTPIARVGDQQTYVFFKDGIETFVIRPGFTGKVEEFGMLIPFPSVPAIRKVSDNIFPHVQAAVDPPEVVIDLRQRFLFQFRQGAVGGAVPQKAKGLDIKKNDVRVVKEEAVGMYEVAVLEAGSAAALNRWMDAHGYKYPEGMDKPCNDYVADGWCFVAIKTKVGAKGNVDPKPGMRKVTTSLPSGSTFDGNVQAMGFRFPVKELVVPMRLSTFNEGDLHNIVYVLADDPVKIRSVPEEYVVRQIPGEQLFKNVANPLPLRIIGGTKDQITENQKRNLKQRRDPSPHNGAAKDLFAADLLAVSAKRLVHPHEEQEKMFLRIGEKLGLRGPDIDRWNEQALVKDRAETVKSSLEELKSMQLTVIDGDFPREVLAARNLTFTNYTMSARRNSPNHYHAVQKAPARKQEGVLEYGTVSQTDAARRRSVVARNTRIGLGMLAFAMIGMMWVSRRRGS